MGVLSPFGGAFPEGPSAATPPEASMRSATILRVPLALLRFHQPMAEHGPGACAQPIGEAFPPGHRQFRSSSD
ncbi:MAG: hypothetical protein ACKOZW_09080 [Cyanobium sp.]